MTPGTCHFDDPQNLSFRPKRDGFIVPHSGETCSSKPAQANNRSFIAFRMTILFLIQLGQHPKTPPNPNECNTLPVKSLDGILYRHKSRNSRRINSIHHPNRMNTLPATPLNGILYKNRGEGGSPTTPNLADCHPENALARSGPLPYRYRVQAFDRQPHLSAGREQQHRSIRADAHNL
jgi:hypothetical protein